MGKTYISHINGHKLKAKIWGRGLIWGKGGDF